MAPIMRCLTSLVAAGTFIVADAAFARSTNHYNIGPDSHLSTWQQIHQTLNAYAVVIDFKQFDQFQYIFTEDAFANYTGPLSSLKGLAAIEQGLQASVATIATQHALSTVLIDTSQVDEGHHGARVGSRATSTTYFQAQLFGQDKLQGEVVYMYGNYQDELTRTKQGWRISKRQLVFMGPVLGNLAVIGQ